MVWSCGGVFPPPHHHTTSPPNKKPHGPQPSESLR
jgi:hypothetical protein